jgi:hypothetical protein
MFKKLVIATVFIFIVITAALFSSGKISTFKSPGKEAFQQTSSPISPKTESSFGEIGEALINQVLEEYLPSILKAAYGGKVFCSHYLYGYDQKEEKSEFYVYVWVNCEEYYKQGTNLKLGSGVSMPVRVSLASQNGKLVPQGYIEPENGEGYASSIKAMFPENYASDAILGYDVSKFPQSPGSQAKEFFKSDN